mgnify:FL=1
MPPVLLQPCWAAAAVKQTGGGQLMATWCWGRRQRGSRYTVCVFRGRGGDDIDMTRQKGCS